MEEPKKQEKRRFVRVEITVPVKYRSYRNDSIFRANFNVGRSRDMSVGGLKVSVSKHNPVDSKLDMEIELPDSMPAYVIGKVVGGEDVVIDGIVHHYDRISFVDMDKEIQDVIMKQIFENLRKKGPKSR
jgi:hypothetical protein